MAQYRSGTLSATAWLVLFSSGAFAADSSNDGGDDVTTSSMTPAPAPRPNGAPFPTQQIMSTAEFIGIILFVCLVYYASIYMCAKAVGENTSAMSAPARYAGTAAGATGGLISRFIKFLRSRGGVSYIPLAPSEETFGSSSPARRRAMEIGHGQTHEDDFFSAANDPAPTVSASS